MKVGLAIDISELHLFKDESAYQTAPPQVWEKFAWENELEDGVYKAAVDTTFFLYTADQNIRPIFSDYALRQPRVPAIRIAKEGFITKHRPWYKECGQTAEEKEFYKSTVKRHAIWLKRSS